MQRSADAEELITLSRPKQLLFIHSKPSQAGAIFILKSDIEYSRGAFGRQEGYTTQIGEERGAKERKGGSLFEGEGVTLGSR